MLKSRGKIQKILKKLVILFGLSLLAFLVVSILIYFYLSHYSKNFIYSDTGKIPKNEVGLVLGTSPVTRQGEVSVFFTSRMEAVKELFEKQKVNYIIVSGDNETVSYNEPKYMRNYLLKIGIPDAAIVSDYAGRRTLDSVLRSSEIFNQYQITILSQRFHNQRAIFIARKSGIDAIAYDAKYPYANSFKNLLINTKTFARELLARDLAVFDILIEKKPQILGNSIEIKNERIEGVKRLILGK